MGRWKNVIGISLTEGLIILTLSAAVFFLSANFDLLERIVEFSRRHEKLEVDEIITVALFLVLVLGVLLVRKIHQLMLTQKALNARKVELEESLSEIRQLKGIIPICASCKMIRNDDGYWQKVEVYVQRHTDAQFSHSICPDCTEKLYPEIAKQINREMKN